MMKGGGRKKRSENEKERTKMRERRRRAITTNIFKGLRKHSGYRLSHRSDINAVLRQLANEAGFVVEPDGTTYRSKALIKCPQCGAASANFSIPNTIITTNGRSFVMAGVGNSSTAPPFPLPREINNNSSIRDLAGTVIMASLANDDHGANNNIIGCSSPLLGFDGPISVPVYTNQNEANVDGGGGFAECCAAMAMGGNVRGSGMTYEEMQREALLLEEVANMSNSNHIHNTMVGPMPMSLPHY